MKTKLLLTGLSLLLGVLFLSAQTIIKEGPVSGIWTKEHSPYLIQGKIIIPQGKTLKVEPGVDIIFQSIKGMQIKGRLLAVGNENDSITFTTDKHADGWSGLTWESGIIQDLKHEQGSRIIYCNFTYCKDYGEYQVNSGGAIRIFNKDNIIIKNCTFEYNEALLQDDNKLCGGAITLSNSNAKITHCVFRYNMAKEGGALLLLNHSEPVIDNCLFNNNYTVNSGASVSLDNYSYPQFINCTFSDNYALKNGGVFNIKSYSHPVLTNCILWNNSALKLGDQVYFDDITASLSIYNSNVEGGYDALEGDAFFVIYENNMDKDPIWFNSQQIKYSLSPFSPCRDIACGNGDHLPPDWECPCADLANNIRISGCELDLGCYEYQVVDDPGDDKINKSSSLDAKVYPFPVQSQSWISFVLLKDSKVEIDIYDMNGKRVEILLDQKLNAGKHEIVWDASDLPGGVYIYKILTEHTKLSNKVIVSH